MFSDLDRARNIVQQARPIEVTDSARSLNAARGQGTVLKRGAPPSERLMRRSERERRGSPSKSMMAKSLPV